jgi:hypothetical protein
MLEADLGTVSHETFHRCIIARRLSFSHNFVTTDVACAAIE